MHERILVVDDDADVRKTLSSILSEEGYIVATVENGKQALKATEKELFDLALIDVELPGMKGTELLHKLKENQPRIVKIIVTGYPSFDNAMKAVNEGADGYVLKPFEPGKLLKIVRKHLDERATEYLRIRTEIEQTNKFEEQFKKPKGSFEF